MGFICPDCGKDFGRDKETFERHRSETHPVAPIRMTPHDPLWEYIQPKTPKRRPSPNLSALVEAVKDGRIRVRVGFDGDIVFRVEKTKKEYTIPAHHVSGDYEGFDDNA